MVAIFSILLLLLTAHGTASLWQPRMFEERCIIMVMGATLSLLLVGYGLSLFQQMGNPWAWILAQFGLLLVLCLFVFRTKRQLIPSVHSLSKTLHDQHQWLKSLSARKQLLLLALILTVASVVIVNFIFAIQVAPTTVDSLTYHLPRAAYALQWGHIGPYEANYDAQIVHYKNGTVLLTYVLALTRSGTMAQLVQFSAYIACFFVLASVVRSLQVSRYWRWITTLTIGLLPIMILQATTTQNDLLVMLYCGIVLAALLYFRRYRQTRYLLLSATSGATALGVKISAALVFPALLFVALVWVVPHIRRKQIIQTIAGTVLAVSLLVLPAGFISNWSYYGHPLGSESWRTRHSFHDISLVDRTEATVMNSLRYVSDFISLGGFSNRQRFPSQWLAEAKAVAGHLLTDAGLHLESKQYTRTHFTYSIVNRGDSESHAYLGEIGWLLLLPLVGIALFHRKHSTGHDARMLSIAFFIFLLTQAVVAPYDIWRGRYFVTGAFFLLPVMALYADQIRYMKASVWRHFIRIWFVSVLLLACISALLITESKLRRFPFWQMDRIAMLTSNMADTEPALRLYEQQVPSDATVILALDYKSLEYVFFGEDLTRTLYPFKQVDHSSTSREEVDFLLYTLRNNSNRYGIIPRSGDLYLGFDDWSGWYLRPLH